VPIVVETDDKTVAIDAVDHQEEGLEGGLHAQVISIRQQQKTILTHQVSKML